MRGVAKPLGCSYTNLGHALSTVRWGGTSLATFRFDFDNARHRVADRSNFFPMTPRHPMATKQSRGTKRTCQSGECGARFYDLNRDPIVCPICGTLYEIASSPMALSAAGAEERVPRKAKKPEFVAEESLSPGEIVEAEGDEVLPDAEGDEEIATEADETFLEEEEEDGGDMTNIIGGPVAEDDEGV